METETIAAIDYRGWVIEPDQKIKRCSACMTMYGAESEDGAILDTGFMLVDDSVRGRCRRCGHPIKWYATDRLMRSLVERIRAR